MKKYLYILFVLIGSFAQAQNRPAHWLHGLNDDADLWKIYGPLFQNEREMTSNTPNYYNNNGVLDATNRVRNLVPRNNQNFLIGHSLGGLVAREYERQTGSANAILTIGTPNEGAYVANNVRNGKARITIDNAIGDMIAGPYAQSKNTLLSVMSNLSSFNIITYWANKKIEEFTEEALLGVISKKVNIKDTRSMEDLSVGSTYITGLNAANRNVAIANIVCEENDHAALRMGNAFIRPPQDASLHSYEDNDLKQDVDKLHDIYKALRIYHDVRKFTFPLRYGHHDRMANRWQRGEDFMDDQLEPDYASIIGAVRREARTSTQWVETCTSGDCGSGGGPMLIDDAGCFELIPIGDEWDLNCTWTQKQVTTYVTIVEKHDGLVTEGTQRLDGVPDDRVYSAVGVNHMEVGNHPEMTRRFNDVFNRRDDFEIERRQ